MAAAVERCVLDRQRGDRGAHDLPATRATHAAHGPCARGDASGAVGVLDVCHTSQVTVPASLRGTADGGNRGGGGASISTTVARNHRRTQRIAADGVVTAAKPADADRSAHRQRGGTVRFWPDRGNGC